MPKSEYASFDFYNYRSAALEAVNGFSVGFSAPRPAESGATGSLDETPRISTEAMSLLIAALYESAMDPQHWKVFWNCCVLAPMATMPRSWCATPW